MTAFDSASTLSALSAPNGTSIAREDRKMTKGETQDELCRRMIEGESLRAICRSDDMPAKSTICRWLAADDAFREHYAHAREMQGDALADQMLDIADTPIVGSKTTTKATGTEVVEGDMIEHRRLQVDTRKWIASRLFPKKYGDAAMLKLADAEGKSIPVVGHDQVAARLAAMALEINVRQGKERDDV